MHLVIAVVVSLCANVNMTDVNKRVSELQRQHPEAKVSVRFDKKCKLDTE